MNERKVRETLKQNIMRTEYHWITPSVLNDLLDQGIESIQRNLNEGNIDLVDEKVTNYVSYKLVDQLH